MTHKYKVGDKVRMLKGFLSSDEGKTYTVCGLGATDTYNTVKVSDADGYFWSTRAECFEIVTDGQENTQ